MKNIKTNHMKINIFTAAKYCCILHGRVFVMNSKKSKAIEWLQNFSNCNSTIRIFTDAQIRSPIRLKFELIRAFIVVLVTFKNDEGPIKMKALEC